MNDTGSNLTPFEFAVIEAFFGKEGVDAQATTEALRRTRAQEREFTGVGFITRLDAASAPTIPGRSSHDRALTGVTAEIDGLRHGAGFVLFLEGDRITALEGFTYDEAWPTVIKSFSLSWSET